MQSNILKYYGIEDSRKMDCLHFQFDYDIPVNNNSIVSKITKIMTNRNVVLFVAIKVEGIMQRNMPASKLIKQRYGIESKTVCERRLISFEATTRICAVNVQHDQVPALLQILFDLSSRSFAIIMNGPDSSELSKNLLRLFEKGMLIPTVLTSCCNSALSGNASFFHVLRGYDGYSINLFNITAFHDAEN